jgi:hypothetical protein
MGKMQTDAGLGYLKLLPRNFHGETEEKHVKYHDIWCPKRNYIGELVESKSVVTA